MVAVLLCLLLFAAFSGGEQSAKDAETAVLSAYPVMLDAGSVPSGDLGALGDWLTVTRTKKRSPCSAVTPSHRAFTAAIPPLPGREALNSEENNTLWTQLPEGEDLRQMRYTLAAGRWPERYDEAAVLLDARGKVDELPPLARS